MSESLLLHFGGEREITPQTWHKTLPPPLPLSIVNMLWQNRHGQEIQHLTAWRLQRAMTFLAFDEKLARFTQDCKGINWSLLIWSAQKRQHDLLWTVHKDCMICSELCTRIAWSALKGMGLKKCDHCQLRAIKGLRVPDNPEWTLKVPATTLRWLASLNKLLQGAAGEH